MKLRATLLLPLLAAPTCANAPQDPKPQPPAPAAANEPGAQDAQKVLDEVRAQFAKEGIVVDAKAQTITIDVEMNHPGDLLEYFLIHRRGKVHEAVLTTKTKPSVLNAAFLMLGFEPGKNATAKEKDPPPSLEEVEKGVDPVIVTPPEGMELWMTVKWSAGGKDVEYCVEDLILDLTTQEPLANASWLYLGGRMAPLYKDEPPVYVADFEGNLASICYLSPDNHLVTMRHAHARDDQNFWLTPKCPEPGTPMKLTFWKTKPKLAADREERLKKEAEAKAKDGAPPKDQAPPAGQGKE